MIAQRHELPFHSLNLAWALCWDLASLGLINCVNISGRIQQTTKIKLEVWKVSKVQQRPKLKSTKKCNVTQILLTVKIN